MNPRQMDYDSTALPTELLRHITQSHVTPTTEIVKVIGDDRLNFGKRRRFISDQRCLFDPSAAQDSRSLVEHAGLPGGNAGLRLVEDDVGTADRVDFAA